MSDTQVGVTRRGLVDGMSLVDHHCHGIFTGSLDRRGFESRLTEADGPGRWHDSLFDTQAGMAVRAICAPLLDLPPHADAEDYLARRVELGASEVARRMLEATGISTFLVDTGFGAHELTPPAELAAYTGGRAHEIVRLETLAEVVLRSEDARHFAEAFPEALARHTANAVGCKSIAAYRGGLALDPDRPSATEVNAVARAWADAVARGAAPRLADATLIRFLIWSAVDLGKPLQFHVGYGDGDVALSACDPMLLGPLLRATDGLGTPIMLLHNYPYHRQAGMLAQLFDHVFVDVGLALHNLGARADAVLAELLELAPFSSVLFSSDAAALAELYAINAVLFRRALGRFLEDGVTREFWTTRDAERVAGLITSGNAGRAYGLSVAH